MAGARKWKPAVLKLHRWIALSVGLVLMLNAFTGLVLLAGRPLDEALNPHLFKVEPQPPGVSLESIRQSLQAESARQTLIIRPGRAPEDALTADVRGDSGWEGQVFIDPYTGRRLGARDRFNIGLNGLFELHSTLLSGSFGKGLLALCAAGFGVMLLSGLTMWWPIRWRMAFKVVLGTGRVRSLFDLHRVGGALLGVWVLVVSATTGGVLAWRPATAWFNQLVGNPTTEAPKVPAGAPAVGTSLPTVDALLQQAEAALPGGRVGSIQLPAKASQAVRVRKKVDGDPHPNGLSTVWLNARTGEVLRVDRWNSYSWFYTMHAGHLGGAVVGTVVTAVSGLSLLGFGVTGTWLWWLRRKTRSSPAAAARPTARGAS
jgi:uncharacterized iron-regulated membrane protein